MSKYGKNYKAWFYCQMNATHFGNICQEAAKIFYLKNIEMDGLNICTSLPILLKFNPHSAQVRELWPSSVQEELGMDSIPCASCGTSL